MCGIAGIVMRDGSPADPAVLERLAAAMAHRGPDGVGVHQAGPVGLVSTRLAIIDLATGDQPLFACAIAWVWLKEIPTWLTVAGGTLAIVGVVLATTQFTPAALWRRRVPAERKPKRSYSAIAELFDGRTSSV